MAAKRKYFKEGMMARILLISDGEGGRMRRGQVTMIVNQDQLYITIDGTDYLAARVPYKNVFHEQGAG